MLRKCFHMWTMIRQTLASVQTTHHALYAWRAFIGDVCLEAAKVLPHHDILMTRLDLNVVT